MLVCLRDWFGCDEHFVVEVFLSAERNFNCHMQALKEAAKLSKAATKLRKFSFHYGGSSPTNSESATTPKTTPTHATPSTPTSTPTTDPKGESSDYSSEHGHPTQWVDHIAEADGTSGHSHDDHAQHRYEEYSGHPGGTGTYYEEDYDNELYDTYEEQPYHANYNASGDPQQPYEQHGHVPCSIVINPNENMSIPLCPSIQSLTCVSNCT